MKTPRATISANQESSTHIPSAPTGIATTLANTPTFATWALAAIRSPGLARTTGSRLERLMPNRRDNTNIANATGNSRKPSSQTTMARASAARRPLLNTIPPR